MVSKVLGLKCQIWPGFSLDRCMKIEEEREQQYHLLKNVLRLKND